MTDGPSHPDLAGLKVPVALRADVAEIIGLTDAFCKQHLDREYLVLCRRLVARLARKRPSPLLRGELTIWAAAAVYTVGSLNFLFDRSQTPCLGGEDIAAEFGVPKNTIANKAAQIRKLLGLREVETELMRRSVLEQHPLAWLVEVDGLLIDARALPPALQDEARRRGLIPDLDRSPVAV